jgi:DNA-binding FadR family transcriptional regulator
MDDRSTMVGNSSEPHETNRASSSENVRAAFERVRGFLSAAVKEGAYALGARLPTERELAATFGASRAVTRRALSELEKEGLIERHVGRGTFVAQPRERAEVLNPIIPEGTVSPAEYFQARMSLEPELARYIVANATAADFALIDEQLRRGEFASSREEFELADAAFHQCLVRATHNTLLIAMYELIHSVRHEQSMWFKLRQLTEVADQRHIFQSEHAKIRDALAARNTGNAQSLLAEHIRATRRRILDF